MYAAIAIAFWNVSVIGVPPEVGYIRDDRGNLLPLPAMRFIKGGEFVMGSPITDPKSVAYHPEELPARKVKVKSFYLSRFPVTNEEFCVFLNEEGIQVSSRRYGIEPVDGKYRPSLYKDRLPAVSVTWVNAVRYCEWLSKKAGRRYRLPTEAEWEFAARGPESRKWPWGSEEPWRRGEGSPERDGDKVFLDLRGYKWIAKPTAGALARWGLAPVGCFPKGQTPGGLLDDGVLWRPMVLR